MSLADVALLVRHEEDGVEVVSWQAHEVWHRCKSLVVDDGTALKLSRLMRVNQHHYLLHLAEAIDEGVPDVLLQFLHPEYALQRVLADFDPTTYGYASMTRATRADTYAKSKAARSIRIAFDALRDYGSRSARNIKEVDPTSIRSAHIAYKSALQRAKAHPSELRPILVDLLSSTASEEQRTSILTVALNGRYLPSEDYSYVRSALEALTTSYAEILSDEFRTKLS